MAIDNTNLSRSIAGAWRAMMLMVALGATATAQQPSPSRDERVDLVRTAMEKWVETRRTIAKTQRDWQSDRERLADNIALMEREIEALRGRIAEAEASTTEAEQKKVELAGQVGRLQQAGRVFAERIARLEERTVTLLRRLPEPIAEQLAPLRQRLPADAAAAAKLDDGKLSQRYLTVVGVLNEVDKWNREVTITSEVRQLGGGVSAEVTALYLGIGQGFYVTQKGDAAGIGTAGPDGWVWTPRNESAAAIKDAIAMARNELVAGFVQLPVEIR